MEDRKRAEALVREVDRVYLHRGVELVLAAFAEERRLERELIFGSIHAGGPLRAAGASEGPAEGLPPAESQGAPTASAIRAEGTPQPEPLREAADALMEAASILDIAHNDHDAGARALAASRKARPLAAATSAQPPLAEPSPPTPQASETPAEGEVWSNFKGWVSHAEREGYTHVSLTLKDARALIAQRRRG